MNVLISRRFPLWLIVTAACLVACLNNGPRTALGFYLLPMTEVHDWSRSTFALAMAIQSLTWGIGAVVFGALADRYGTARVLVLGALLYAAGLAIMAVTHSATILYLGGGALIGFGIAGCSFGIVMAALGRNVSPEQRSLVFGFTMAAASFGQFLFSPLTQGLIQETGWQESLFILAAIMLLVPLLAIPLQGKPAAKPTAAGIDQSIREALAEAFGHSSFLLLAAGFFVCGFHLSFIVTHLPAFIGDVGMDARWGVIALMLIGLFNIAGSLAAGVLGMRYPKRYLLAGIYLARTVAFGLFVLLPPTPLTVVLFASAMGLLWLSTVPLTNALVAIMFGTRHFAMLAGVVFLSHQLGSFLGVWLGGKLYDLNHSYEPMWWIGVGLGLFAALVHMPIRERAVETGSLATA